MRSPTGRLLVAAAVLLGAAPAAAQTSAQNDSAARAATRTNSLPLINTRTLKFTTDEGSWISLDLSRDGQTIVFELLGDLYTLPVAGGTAKRITSGQGTLGAATDVSDGGSVDLVVMDDFIYGEPIKQ